MPPKVQKSTFFHTIQYPTDLLQ